MRPTIPPPIACERRRRRRNGDAETSRTRNTYTAATAYTYMVHMHALAMLMRADMLARFSTVAGAAAAAAIAPSERHNCLLCACLCWRGVM